MKVVKPASYMPQTATDDPLISVLAASVMMLVLAALMWFAFTGLFHS